LPLSYQGNKVAVEIPSLSVLLIYVYRRSHMGTPPLKVIGHP
jgi:hypothetical protein